MVSERQREQLKDGVALAGLLMNFAISEGRRKMAIFSKIFGPPDIERLREQHAIQKLIRALNHKDDEVAWHAMEALTDIGQPAVELLCDAIQNKHIKIRRGVIEVLGNLGDKRAVPTLCLALNDPTISDVTAAALGKIGDNKAVDPLLNIINKYQYDPRGTNKLRTAINATTALRKIGDTNAAESLASILSINNFSVHKNIVEALVNIGQNAINPLCKALSDENVQVRSSAANILDKLDWQPSHDEIGAYYWVTRGDWQKCIRIGLSSIKPLNNFLQSNDSISERFSCYSALVQIQGTNISAKGVLKLVEDVAIEIRRLYSRTRTVVVGQEEVEEWGAGSANSGMILYRDYRDITVEEPDPDILGIRKLIEKIPFTLRERVQNLSGEAKNIFDG